jgi:hypothetical protein
MQASPHPLQRPVSDLGRHRLRHTNGRCAWSLASSTVPSSPTSLSALANSSPKSSRTAWFAVRGYIHCLRTVTVIRSARDVAPDELTGDDPLLEFVGAFKDFEDLCVAVHLFESDRLAGFGDSTREA